MEGTDNSKINKISQKQYIKLLERHFDFTVQYRKIYMEPEIEGIEKLILDYRKKNSVKYPSAFLIMTLIYGFIAAAAMGILILWVINEIIKYPVDYSLKNIIALSIVFFIGRVKLKFPAND